jgi:hypothetical protein
LGVVTGVGRPSVLPDVRAAASPPGGRGRAAAPGHRLTRAGRPGPRRPPPGAGCRIRGPAGSVPAHQPQAAHRCPSRTGLGTRTAPAAHGGQGAGRGRRTCPERDRAPGAHVTIARKAPAPLSDPAPCGAPARCGGAPGRAGLHTTSPGGQSWCPAPLCHGGQTARLTSTPLMPVLWESRALPPSRAAGPPPAPHIPHGGTRPIPKSAGAQMRYLVKQLKGTARWPVCSASRSTPWSAT